MHAVRFGNSPKQFETDLVFKPSRPSRPSICLQLITIRVGAAAITCVNYRATFSEKIWWDHGCMVLISAMACMIISRRIQRLSSLLLPVSRHGQKDARSVIAIRPTLALLSLGIHYAFTSQSHQPSPSSSADRIICSPYALTDHNTFISLLPI